MRYRLRTSVPVLQRLVARDAPTQRVVRAGISRSTDTEEWLLTADDVAVAGDAPHEGRAHVQVTEDEASWQRALTAMPGLGGAAPWLALKLGRGAAAGSISAIVRAPHGMTVVDDVTVVGAGLPTVELAPLPVTHEMVERLRANQAREASAWARLSRTIGALGEASWRQLRQQHIGIVGAGRTGSLVLSSLAQGGVRRLVIVDPDLIEPHNLGEMDALRPEDVGRPKVAALAERVGAPWDTEVTGLAASVDSLPAAAALRTADALISCADDPVARLLASLIGAVYLRPVLDIGTGVFGDGPARRMGADVRLLLPGACLLCGGGLPGLGETLAGERQSGELWRRQRAGSLRTLNQTAVGLGLRLLEDLVGGRVSGSRWLRLAFDADGLPRLDCPPVSASSTCPVCRVSAGGDAVLSRVPDILRQARAFLRETAVRPA